MFKWSAQTTGGLFFAVLQIQVGHRVQDVRHVEAARPKGVVVSGPSSATGEELYTVQLDGYESEEGKVTRRTQDLTTGCPVIRFVAGAEPRAHCKLSTIFDDIPFAWIGGETD